jgi:FtsH-binding integral membrane protein
LNFSTSGQQNSGEVHGFLENTADISSMTLTGSYIGAAALQVVAVPEPETYAMMIAGLGLMGFMVRRKKTA